jgi:hypothetical protein
MTEIALPPSNAATVTGVVNSPLAVISQDSQYALKCIMNSTGYSSGKHVIEIMIPSFIFAANAAHPTTSVTFFPFPMQIINGVMTHSYVTAIGGAVTGAIANFVLGPVGNAYITITNAVSDVLPQTCEGFILTIFTANPVEEAFTA